jgi:glutamyl-Q tRNA(Asp) synthetase
MEDLDPPREQPGAADAILHSLEQHGLHWDDEVLWQGSRAAAYDQALTSLRRAGHLFHCDCTRQTLGPEGCCGGRCRPRQAEVKPPVATRVAVAEATTVDFDDLWQGQQHCELGQSVSDFTVLRKDGLYAYQLAVVVDDADQGINHVIRGSDLLDSTARQIYLQQILGYSTPVYGHFPVLLNEHGQKLSKQNRAPAIDNNQARDNLRQALHFLRQPVPPASLATAAEVLAFATANWSRQKIPAGMGLAAD